MKQVKQNSTLQELDKSQVSHVSGGIVPVIIGAAVIGGLAIWPTPAHNQPNKAV